MASTALDKARQKYDEKRQIKKVSFNPDTEKNLLDFANSVNFSEWVKQKIKEELNKALT